MPQPTLAKVALPTKNQWQILWHNNKPLTFVALFSAALLLVTLIGLTFDTRTILGQPIWAKPAKFAISITFYCATLILILQYLTEWPRLVQVVSWGSALMLFGELALITLQAVRGVQSHFNQITAFDSAVFSLMGTMIGIFWLINIVASLFLIRQKFERPTWGLSLKFAMIIAMMGAGLGWVMTAPTAEQTAAMNRGDDMPPIVGAHSIGVPDGGKGLPFVGWSTEGGDLRIGHFVGLHAMQVLPLAGWFLVRQNQHLQEQRQKGLIWTVALGYFGVMVIVTWQALRGEPLIYPSMLTMTAWGILFAIIIGAAAWFLRPQNEVGIPNQHVG